MRRDAVEALSLAVAEAGLAGASEADLLRDFCQRAAEAGLGLSRVGLLVDTLHPVHEGRVFHWRDGSPDVVDMQEYGRTNRGGELAENWQRSPFYRMLQSGESAVRIRLSDGEATGSTMVDQFRDEGHTEWFALLHRFTDAGSIGELDCLFSSWGTRQPDGFTPDQVSALKRLVPVLGLGIKAASLARIAETLVETYLGRDPGRHVLRGRIERGVTDRIEAALWFSDLRGYTTITGAAAPDQIIPFLNDYAEAVISSVEEAGGDVLKLLGDGTLAIFKNDTLAGACRCALRAQALAQGRIAALNARRQGEGLPVTYAYLGLHVGAVLYGNVGSDTRLDFTVVGPAVNEASRIAALCRSVERPVLASAAFADVLDADDRARLVSVGKYALRGIERPRELFTLVPDE